MNSRPATSRLRRILPLAVALAVGAGAGAGAYALTSHSGTATTTRVVIPAAQPASSSSTVDSLTQLYKRDAPGVVDITVISSAGGGTSAFPFGQGGSQKQEAEGTGFEIDSKGDILTAEHVVDGAQSIRVMFQNGTTAKATLVGTPDKSTDTAVIHVNVPASQLHPLTLGRSADVQPGQTVVAIGSNLGLPETMTAGIVSATNRTITAPNGFSITGAIQTDAAINHGNSGGPLIDAATNTVIGINDQIQNEGDTQDNAGVGFAAPIDASRAVAETLIAGGTVQHAYLGVTISSTGPAKVRCIVNGGPAAAAGLKAGDVVTALDGKSISSYDALTAALGAMKPGDKVTLTVTNKGSTRHVSVTLGSRPASTNNNCRTTP